MQRPFAHHTRAFGFDPAPATLFGMKLRMRNLIGGELVQIGTYPLSWHGVSGSTGTDKQSSVQNEDLSVSSCGADTVRQLRPHAGQRGFRCKDILASPIPTLGLHASQEVRFSVSEVRRGKLTSCIVVGFHTLL
jgi:hypothetical protein